MPTVPSVLAPSFEALPELVLTVRRRSLQILGHNRPSGALGYRAEELSAKSLQTLLPGIDAELLESTLRGEHDPHAETPLRAVSVTADDAEQPVDVRASALDAERALVSLRLVSVSARIAERRLVTVICSAPMAIITWDRGGSIVSWNPGAERLYGVSASEAIGSPIERLIPESGLPSFRSAQAELLAGGPPPVLEAVRVGTERELEVEESWFLVRDHTQHPLGIGCFSRDLSSLLRLRQAAEVLSNTAQAARVPTPRSAAMAQLHAAANLVARESIAPVLLLGETGVGKSTLARRIHALGPRAGKPFLEVSCASLEPQLLESELFGHERGAFTSAVTQKRGLVEIAEGGTLFLDEVGELPAAAQAKLLSFLDQGVFRRIGGTRSLRSDVRIIAATNADLAAAVEAKTFRKDLYYRLKVLPLELPPLRERREDLPSLTEQLLLELRGRQAPAIGPGVEAALRRYAWPGNLRELRNTLERAAILCGGGPIGIEHLPLEIRQPRAADTAVMTLAELEAQHLRRVLEACQGNRTRAAEQLGVDRSTLRRKLAELELDE